MSEPIHMEMGTAEHDGLPTGTPPPLVERAILHGKQPPPQEAQVVLHQTAMLQIEAHANSNLDFEVGGVLLGKAYAHQAGTYVEVVTAVPAHSDQHGPVHFTFTADAWAQITADRERLYPDLQIIGWFHTHPDLGVFYSSDDIVVHSVAFAMPWHVGVVLDPIRRECGLFGWVPVRQADHADIQPLRGYYELLTDKKVSAVNWQFVRHASLRDMMQAMWPADIRGGGDGNPYDHQIYVATREVTLFPPRINFILASTAVFLALLLLLAGVLPLRSRNTALEQMVQTAATSQLLGAAQTGWASCDKTTVQILAPSPQTNLRMGQEVAIFGVATEEKAAAYHLDVRAQTSNRWTSLGTARTWGRPFRQLGTWDTGNMPPGRYKLRLLPYDANGRPIPLSACTVDVELVR